MNGTRFSARQIVNNLRKADVLIAKDQTVAQVSVITENRPRVITSSVPARPGPQGARFPPQTPLARVGGVLGRKSCRRWSGRFNSIIGGRF